MGFIGKVMVLLHGALSITVLAWVVGVVTHRIDWNNPPPPEAGGKDKGPGLYDKQKTKAADYTAAVDRAYNRWTTNRNQVDVLEVERYPRRTFYATHLYMIQTGELPGTKVANPVQDIFPLAGNGYLDVRIGPNGQLDVAQAIGRKAVEVRPGVAARAIVQYERDMNKRSRTSRPPRKRAPSTWSSATS